MANISRITESVFTGGDLPLHIGRNAMIEHLRDIEDAGITHIIDNRIEWSDEAFVLENSPKISYLHNPQDDAGQRMPDSWFDRGVGFAQQALEDNPEARVLAHCHMGINRGPSMAFAILLAQGHDPVEALGAIRDARDIAAIAYAEDALDWWHRTSKASPDVVARQRSDVAAWFEAHPIDTVYTIRTVREEEGLIW